jgi:hypothetical protein
MTFSEEFQHMSTTDNWVRIGRLSTCCRLIVGAIKKTKPELAQRGYTPGNTQIDNTQRDVEPLRMRFI